MVAVKVKTLSKPFHPACEKLTFQQGIWTGHEVYELRDDSPIIGSSSNTPLGKLIRHWTAVLMVRISIFDTQAHSVTGNGKDQLAAAIHSLLLSILES